MEKVTIKFTRDYGKNKKGSTKEVFESQASFLVGNSFAEYAEKTEKEVMTKENSIKKGK